MKKLILILCLLLAIQITAQKSKNDEIVVAVNKKLDDLWGESNAPGISLSIAFPNGETETFTRGFADVEKDIKMTSKTRMLGGSTGKIFYSVIALQLIEEGKLKLDDPIFNIMSDYSWFSKMPNAKKLTVRSLMRHETGIPRYIFTEAFQTDILKDVNKVWKPDELLSYVFDEKPLFNVGEGFTYSDTNYVILGMLIEKITGNTLSYHEPI